MPAMDFCNTMEFPLATLWIFVLQLSVFLSYNKHKTEFWVKYVANLRNHDRTALEEC
jgi:MFS superfamily sulfate permease-like transporter